MPETGKTTQRIVLAVVFVLGLGLGWAGATHQAIDASRARNAGGFVTLRESLDAEDVRVLDLNVEQREAFLAAREEAFRQADQMFARLRPEMEIILTGLDRKVRPMLSPRQLAVYDRLEGKRRQEMPQRPVGADD